MELSTLHLQMVIVAVRNEIRRLQSEIAGSEDPTDLEDLLVQWELLQADLKSGYERARARNPELLSYEAVVGDVNFRLKKGGRHPDKPKP